jgi:hypothetical protein
MKIFHSNRREPVMNYLIRDMLAIAEEKYLQVLELLQLTKEQTEFLEKEDVEGFGRHIECKQTIIHRIDLLDASFKGLRTQLQTEYNVQRLEDLGENDTVKKMLETELKTKKALKTALDIDHINTDMAKRLAEKLGDKLKHAGKAPIVLKEYQKEMSGAIFVNRQG